MRTLASFCLLALLAIPACTSSNSGADGQDGGAGASCTGAQECNPDRCTCTDGEAFDTATICAGDRCSVGQSDSYCASVCTAHGGVTAVGPAPNVAASAECDAWCAKGAALGCGAAKCDRFFFCGVGKRSCEAAARAALACAVEKGTWACSKQSDAWSVSSSCGTFTELCGASDAGKD